MIRMLLKVGEECRVLECPEDSIAIGRSPESTVVVASKKVSRLHARIVKVGEEYRVCDAGSGNGTRVNGQKAESRVLGIGDEIQLGDSVLSVLGFGVPTPAPINTAPASSPERAFQSQAPSPSPVAAPRRPRLPMERRKPASGVLVAAFVAAAAVALVIAVLAGALAGDPRRSDARSSSARGSSIESRREADLRLREISSRAESADPVTDELLKEVASLAETHRSAYSVKESEAGTPYDRLLSMLKARRSGEVERELLTKASEQMAGALREKRYGDAVKGLMILRVQADQQGLEALRRQLRQEMERVVKSVHQQGHALEAKKDYRGALGVYRSHLPYFKGTDFYKDLADRCGFVEVLAKGSEPIAAKQPTGVLAPNHEPGPVAVAPKPPPLPAVPKSSAPAPKPLADGGTKEPRKPEASPKEPPEPILGTPRKNVFGESGKNSPLTVKGQKLFVSATGNDSQNGGSPAQALRWTQTAIDRAKPGDGIFLLPGRHEVRPGDKNIAISGKKGTEAMPILLTAFAPGVTIDLRAADTQWGGLRISDGASWIILDGGGSPDPFDESSYWLTIENAGYACASGDGRSSVSVRAVTVQGASDIVIRNVFARRSMGAMASWATRVLIDTCRLVPGEKARDPNVSHGIYAGGTTTIRNTFIKWGGEQRLGLQNNRGGPNVVIERSYITECCAAIKSFNGGVVTARDCWFWDNFEKPCQGAVKEENLRFTPPPPNIAKQAGPGRGKM